MRFRSLLVLVAVALNAPPGPVRDLRFEAGENGWLIRWRAPAEAQPGVSYELQDRGVGAWRALHEGPETRLRVLQPRRGPCRLRVRARSAQGETGPWSEIDCVIRPDAPPPVGQPACRERDGIACLLARFAVRVRWGERDAGRRDATPAPAPPETPGARDFAFGDRRRALTVRVLDRCADAGYFAVEYESRTAEEFVLEITDTGSDTSKSFLAPAHRDRPRKVRYTQVFEACGS